VATETAKKVLPAKGIRFVQGLEHALREADAAVIVTGWKEFLEIPGILARLEHPPLIVDGRRMLDKRRVGRYVGIGL
jgi:UDPglucose 6-dehydrogenase/GDP-mannose 6-dehydrogenase